MAAPSPLMSFDAIDSTLSGCGCLPPDSDGDVGPNHYIGSMNSSIGIYDKTGNALTSPITYNSFFAALGTSTPCGNSQNDGDGVVFYDHIADRWVVSDFAFSGFPGAGPFYQCIGVSKTSDPVSGGWYLYTQQVDPANSGYIGDYPKFGLWPDAYYLSVNEFSGTSTATEVFQGVRVYAFNRAAMINGGAASTIAFSITAANLGDQYSLVPATFRTGAPPAGQPEWLMSVNSSSTAGTVENQVFVRRFHVDFVTPGNSTFGVGANHTPDGIITVNGFIDAGTSTTTNIVPNGTATTTQWLDTLGDKLMYPLVYQNINSKEYIYADQTNAPQDNGTTNNGPTVVRWYQFDMTGNTIPASPTQQQDINNGGDGIFRWMPAINVDGSGNMAVIYSASSSTVNPGIRASTRTPGDPPNTTTETVLWAGTGHQTSTSGRWGDYAALFVDPNDNCTFWGTNEYYAVNGSATWRDRVNLFKLSQCTGSPAATPTPTASITPTPAPTVPPAGTPVPTPTVTPTPSPAPPASAGNVTVTASAGTVGPTGYATLQAAFAAINAGTHQGAINVWIMADTTETGTAVLNSGNVAPASFTSVLVLPNGTRAVSGNLAAPLVDLNGADNVRIDGYNQLTLSNTNTGTTAGTSTVRFISGTSTFNGATNNILANCNILGSSTVPLGTAGGNVLFSTTTANGTNIVGNNNNVVTNNNIGPVGASLPIKCVTMLGTAGNNTVNTGNVINNNNIFDFFNATSNVAGIDIRAGNQGNTISNNRIYQTAARTFTTTALRYSGILFSGTTGANGNFNTISGNVIGFGAANGTGTTNISGSSNEFRGIDLQGSSSGTATQVYGNVISGINQTSSRASTSATGLAAFAGIQAASSTGASATGVFDIGTSGGNVIGSLDGSSTIVINASSTTASTTPIFGILALSGSSNFVNNNQMGAITIQGTGTVTGFRGIIPGGTANTTQTMNNNTIGGPTAAGAIVDSQVGDYSMYAIQSNSGAAVSITGNTIRNMSGNATSNTTGTVVMSGLAITSTATTAACTMSQNTIHSLRNDTSSTNLGAIYAIDYTASTTAAVTANLIERNSVHSIAMTSGSTSSQIYGIIMRGQGTATVQNNMIRLGLDKDGNTTATNGFTLSGIRDSTGATASYYYNSVYVGGTGVASVANTFAFNSTVVTTARSFRNNIFWNARSNASGTGKNYAITVGGTTPNPAGLTSNRNDLYATGTGGFVGLFNGADQATLANWQAATGQDANSISADPLFISPNGTAATGNLHLNGGSPAVGVGTPVTTTNASPLTGILNDFDNWTRSVTTPTIGAVELTVAPALQSALSRLTHGAAGPFDKSLSINTRSIEPRDGSGNFKIILTFDTPVSSGTASVNAGSVGSTTFSGNTMTVNLTGVPDQTNLTLTLSNVAGPSSFQSGASFVIGFLIGDVNGDAVVNAGDTIVVRNNAGATVDNTNFQDDVNIDGFINVGDTIMVRARSSNFLP